MNPKDMIVMVRTLSGFTSIIIISTRYLFDRIEKQSVCVFLMQLAHLIIVKRVRMQQKASFIFFNRNKKNIHSNTL